MLTSTALRQVKPQEKPYKVADQKGLYLHVMPNGSRYWRFKYRFKGKEKLLGLGVYPDVSLADARDARDNYRKLVAKGVDPSVQRRDEKIKARVQAAETFGALAEEWLSKKCSALAPATMKKKREILKNNLLPWLKDRPLKEITPPELLAVVRRVESRGANELAHRTLQLVSQTYKYAVSIGQAERNPAADLNPALAPVVSSNHAAIVDPKKVGELLRASDGFSGTFVVRCALKLAPLLFVRPGELRQAQWQDIDLDNAEWRYCVSKTKTEHIVPLATQAVAILRELEPLTGKGRYVFPSLRARDRPMSENTINAALRRIGFAQEEMTGHGFRATARTILDEVLGIRPDFIEHQLAHAVRDPNGRAYNRTAHLQERRKMMQQWADYLDLLKAGAAVIPINGKAA